MAATQDGSSLEALFARYLAERDDRAISALVQRVRPRLLRVARRIGNPADAEDSVQTALFSLVHRQGPFQAPVLPWLITAVVRTAYAAKAARERQVRLAERLALVPVDGPQSPAGAAIDAEEARRLRERVDRLPPKYRDAVVLHYFQGLSTNEAAALLDATQPAVKKRLERARRLLRTDHPRVAGLMLAVPWALRDAAALAAVGGGVLMPKKIAVLGFALLLGLGGTAVWMSRGTSARERAPRVAKADSGAEKRRQDKNAESAESVREEQERPADETPPAKTGLFGVVVDPAGKPVAGAQVMAWWGRRSWFPTRTAADGSFALAPTGYLARAAQIDVHVVASGFARAITKLNRDQKGRIALVAGGTLRVVVTDDDGPVRDAPVWLCDGNKPVPQNNFQQYPYLFERNTDADGVVEFRLAAGRYRPCVRASGYMPVDGDAVTIAASRAVASEFSLGRGTTFDIVVLGPKRQPIAGADIELRGPRKSGGRGRTDEEGRLRIAGVAPPPETDTGFGLGTWSRYVFWHVTAPGYAASFGQRQLTTQAGREVLEIAMRPGVPVRVRVIDEKGAPVAATMNGSYDANAANPISRRFAGKANAEGWIHLGQHQPGRRRAWVRAGGYMAKQWEAFVGKEPFSQTVVLAKAGGVLRGVVHRADGKPASSGFVRVVVKGLDTWRQPSGRIGPDGTFGIKAVPAGEHELDVQADGFAAQRFPAPSETAKVVLTLRPGAELAGRVESRDGKPLAGINVRIQAMDYRSLGQAVSDADGRFVFRGLEDAKYRLSAHSKQWRSATPFAREYPVGEEAILRMKPADALPGIPFDVRFVTEAGVRVDGTIMMMYQVKGQRWGARALKRLKGNTFRFSFPQEAGSYDLEFHVTGHKKVRVSGVPIEDVEEPVPFEVRLTRGAVVRLRCVDANGAPLRGVSVRWGSQQVRTGDDGSCEFSGLDPGSIDMRIERVGASNVYARLRVRAPGRADAVFKLYGHATVRLPDWTYGDANGPIVVRLSRNGEVVEEKTLDPSRYRATRSVVATLSAAEAGEYEVTVEIAGKRASGKVTIRPGSRRSISLDPR